MKITKAIKRSPEIALILARDPGQVRFLRQWWSELRRSPLESRLPWLPFRAIEILDRALTPQSRVFEFGGGGSTLWFEARSGHVVTVEHDPGWYEVLASTVSGNHRVEVMHRSSDNNYEEYVHSIEAHPDESFDIVVVDGRERVRCVEAAKSKVRRGGLLVLDDTHRDRYAPAFDILSAWPRTTVRGLAPSKSFEAVTTVWTRPEAG